MMYRIKNSLTSNRKGQTLVIAIMVMFLLAMVAAVFIALVARNLFRSDRFSNVDAVTQIAEAGIRYADKMLVTSEDGADWRPVPDNCDLDPNDPSTWGDVTTAFDANPNYPQPLTNWENTMAARYPDFQWTRPYWPYELPKGTPEGKGYAGPTGGYTTFNTGEGRYLLRVSYNPNPKDPQSKYIKIESIGRMGRFEEDDPTTWKPNGNFRMKREITAYKPIGITDYLRFITNKDNRSADFALGCPGYDIKMGRNASGKVRGAPVRVNGNLVLYGGSSSSPIDLYMRGYQTLNGDILPVDRFEIAGDVKFGQDDTGVILHRMGLNGSDLDNPSVTIRPSADTDFSTAGGFFRDAYEAGTDATRRIKRIEAPMIDQTDNSNTTTRYRLLTLNSGERVQLSDDSWFNRGKYGWGRGIYIDNIKDVQNESQTLFGGYTLRYDWLKPNNPASRYWIGPYYVPPAVVINLLPNKSRIVTLPDGSTTTQYYFSITRTDSTTSGQKYVWYDAWGNARPDWGQTVLMPYPTTKHPRVLETSMYNPTNSGASNVFIDGDGVIYAEGNVRIRGMLPPGVQLTVVSNENIYIDGNLLKYRNPANSVPDNDQYRGADDTCGLALLARENICVNTTQFFTPLNNINADDVASDTDNGQPPFHVNVSNSPESRFRCGFEFGPWESDTNGTAPADWRLYLRHSGQYGPSYINGWLNPGGTQSETDSTPINDGGLLKWNTAFDGLKEWVWGVGDPNYGNNGQGVGSAFTYDVFDLKSDINAFLYTNPGGYNTLMLALDQTSYTRNNYEMGGLAVQPYDIRIEAVLYAQEGSFYVLPGNWFNPNQADTLEARNASGSITGVRQMFPCYGQPLDIRVIIDGAVSENVPAPISDVEDWMSKWGKIPATYGSSSTATAHPGEGLTFLYDDHVGWPLHNLGGNDSTPIRTDEFGRPLPIAPRLPVSSSLIYFGDVM